MITFEKITKRFSDQKDPSVKNLNFEIKDGDFVALVGPSGSGKSTILHLIAGLTTPTSGTIRVQNKTLTSLADQEISNLRNRSIGFVFQEFHLIPHLTVRENILLPAKIANQLPSEEKVQSLLTEVGLSHKQNELPSSLSGGQKQRVAIARALINTPSIIIADEPTGNLDQNTAQSIIDLLKKIHQKHKTTLIIATHDPEITKIASRTIQIRDGQIA